jgi:hypothetical protein
MMKNSYDDTLVIKIGYLAYQRCHAHSRAVSVMGREWWETRLGKVARVR